MNVSNMKIGEALSVKRFFRLTDRFWTWMCVGFAAEVLGANYRRFSQTGAFVFCRKGGGFIFN